MARPWEISDLSPDMPLDEAARRVILVRFEQMAAYRDAVLEDVDIEDLHDMRVASRRLRAAWRCFGEFFPGKHTRKFQKEARKVTQVLGPVRDLDVMLEDLRIAETYAPVSIREGFDHFLEFIEDRRREYFRILEHFLGPWNVLLFPAYFQDAEADDAVRRIRFDRQARTVLQQLIADYLGRPACLDDPSATEAHHAMRISGKRLRYAVEIFACAVHHPKAVLKTLQDVQADLGVLHDADVMLDVFKVRRQVCLSIEYPALDWLNDHYRARREAAYRRSVESWKRAVQNDFEKHLYAFKAPSNQQEAIDAEFLEWSRSKLVPRSDG